MYPFLSVIVPVYNVEEYLADCLESILKLDIKDMEILCINDCSTDLSYDILREYEKRERIIKVFNNDYNKGLSYTRNVGIKEARGEYIWFVDSDDVICVNDIRNLFVPARSNNPDIIMFDSLSFNDGSNLVGSKSYRKYYVDGLKSADGKTVFKKMMENGTWDSAVFRRWYRRDFILRNNLKFKEGIINEDVLYSFLAIMKAKRVEVVNEVSYAYRIRRNSITTDSKQDSSRVRDFNYILNTVEEIKNNTNDKKMVKTIELFLTHETRDIVGRIKHMDSIDRGDLHLDDMDYSHIFLGMVGVYNGFFPILLSSEIMNRLRNSKEIVIYGAGKVGTGCLELLKERNINIKCFVESSNTTNDTILGFPVQKIDFFDGDAEMTTLLIMVRSRAAQEEMKRKALTVGFRKENILLYSEIANV